MVNTNKTVAVNLGGGLGTLLTVALVVLKLLGKITISWLWVFSPLWIPWACVLAFLLVIAILAVIAACI